MSGDIAEAREFALEWHGPQMWGKVRYIVHLDAVANLFVSIGAPVWQIIAAYLHDIIEDPKCPKELIAARFGQLVFGWVWAVTGIGSNRKECQQDIVRKLEADTTGAALLKLADRLINVRKCVAERDTQRLKMYRKELAVYDALFERANPVWNAELRLLLATPA